MPSTLARSFQPTPPLRGATRQYAIFMVSCGIFQPTPPLRGATPGNHSGHILAPISTNAPLAGGDSTIHSFTVPHVDFNQRPPCGGRPGFMGLVFSSALFQPTPPLRGATTALTRSHPLVGISTNAPLAGGDGPVPEIMRRLVISTNAPLAGGDLIAVDILFLQQISTNAPLAGGDVALPQSQTHIQRFQPTPPLRGATFVGWSAVFV